MKTMLFSLLFILSACSESPDSPPPSPPSEEVYNLDAQGIGFFSGLVEHSPKIDLNEVTQGQKKSLSISIKNTGSAATPLSSASLSDTKFYITSSTCASKSLPPNGSCSLTLNFSSVGKALQPFESTLFFGSSSIPVRIQVSSPTPPSGSPSIVMYDGTTQISSPPDYAVGSVSGTAKISKVITIKNEGSAATLTSDATLSSPDFYLSSNSCINKSLPVNSSCSVTVNFSGAGKLAGSTKTTNLNFGGGQISLSASVSSPPAPIPAQLVFMDGTTTLSQALHLGNYSSNITLSKTLSIKNIGGTTSASLSLQLLNNSGFFTVANSCANVSLAPGASCSFNLRVSTNKSPGVHSVQLKMDQTTQVVDFRKLSTSGNLKVTLAGAPFKVRDYYTNEVMFESPGSMNPVYAQLAEGSYQLFFEGAIPNNKVVLDPRFKQTNTLTNEFSDFPCFMVENDSRLDGHSGYYCDLNPDANGEIAFEVDISDKLYDGSFIIVRSANGFNPFSHGSQFNETNLGPTYQYLGNNYHGYKVYHFDFSTYEIPQDKSGFIYFGGFGDESIQVKTFPTNAGLGPVYYSATSRVFYSDFTDINLVSRFISLHIDLFDVGFPTPTGINKNQTGPSQARVTISYSNQTLAQQAMAFPKSLVFSNGSTFVSLNSCTRSFSQVQCTFSRGSPVNGQVFVKMINTSLGLTKVYTNYPLNISNGL